VLYIGLSENPLNRLEQHNSGVYGSGSKRDRPWNLVFTEQHPDYKQARKRELQLKAQKAEPGFLR
jgi:putative endonuclease